MTQLHFAKRYLPLLVLTIWMILIGGCVPIQKWSPTPENTGIISYRAYDVHNPDKDFLRLLDPSTLETTTLYETGGTVKAPVWSPSGDQLSFGVWTGKGEFFDLWVINRDGSDLRRVVAGFQVESLVPRGKWSFDEQFLAYRASYNRFQPKEAELFIIKATNGEMIARIPHGWGFEWSPTDDRLAYHPWSDEAGIHVIKADGRDKQLLLPFVFGDDYHLYLSPSLSWSPDGEWIAFAGERANENVAEVMAVNVESGVWKSVTNTAVTGYYLSREISYLAWSPDGNYILFKSTFKRPGEEEIRNTLFLVDVEMGQERELTGPASYQAWSPNGKFIAFMTKRNDDQNEQIYTIELSTGEIVKLTDTSAAKEFLAWR